MCLPPVQNERSNFCSHRGSFVCCIFGIKRKIHGLALSLLSCYNERQKKKLIVHRPFENWNVMLPV